MEIKFMAGIIDIDAHKSPISIKIKNYALANLCAFCTGIRR